MYGIRQCNRIFLSGEIGAFFTEIFFQISVVILNSNLHYQIFKFVIDNSDISLNCLQHIQKRRNFDAKVTCHQPICLLLQSQCHTKWSRSGINHHKWNLFVLPKFQRSSSHRAGSGEHLSPCVRGSCCCCCCCFDFLAISVSLTIYANLYGKIISFFYTFRQSQSVCL